MKIPRIVGIIALTIASLQLSAQNTLTLDWGNTTNYLAHGRTLSADQACFQPGIYYSLKKGPTVSAWFSLAYDRTFSALDEWNIIVDDSYNLLNDKNWNINLHGYANYWYLPVNEDVDYQDYYQGMKYHAGVHFPVMLSNNNPFTITTGYDYYYYHQLGRDVGIRAGGIHELLIKFNKTVKKVSYEAKTLVSNNRGAVSYNIDPGWAYVSQHLSCTINTKHVSLRPSISYQWTLESTIHQNNLLYFGLNIGKTIKL